jgi:hypothetical protein
MAVRVDRGFLQKSTDAISAAEGIPSAFSPDPV